MCEGDKKTRCGRLRGWFNKKGVVATGNCTGLQRPEEAKESAETDPDSSRRSARSGTSRVFVPRRLCSNSSTGHR